MSESPLKVVPISDALMWDSGLREEAGKALEEYLESCDRIVILGVRRVPQGASKVHRFVCSRGVQVTALELIGALQMTMHEWLAELAADEE